MKTGGTDHLSVMEFRSWLLHGEPGSAIEYALGELSRDCEIGGDDTAALRELRSVASAAAAAGVIYLTQRAGAAIQAEKNGKVVGIKIRKFHYVATKRNAVSDVEMARAILNRAEAMLKEAAE